MADTAGLDYSGLPTHIQGGVRHYIEHGDPVGYFLTQVIQNNLSGALSQADEINRARIFDIVSWFYNEAPGQCWGSPDNMHAWMAQQQADTREEAPHA